MSLKTIIEDASVECGVAEPSIVVGNPDIVVRKMLRAANRVGLDLVKRAPWGVLRRVGNFTAVAGQEQPGFLPADFDRLIAETLWDRTNRRLIAGSADAARWQSLAATVRGTLSGYFTLRGTALTLYPAAQGGESMWFEYVSRNFAVSAAGAGLRANQGRAEQPRRQTVPLERIQRLPAGKFYASLHHFHSWRVSSITRMVS